MSKKVFYSMLLFTTFCFGISLQIKANIGQSSLNALALSITYLFDVKIGTVLNIINGLFWIAAILLNRFKIGLRELIQIVATMANGIFINFFVYNILSGYQLPNYYTEIGQFIVGLLISSSSLGIMLAIGIISFPVESFSIAIGVRVGKSLTQVRLLLDTIFLSSSVILSVITKSPLPIREGTIISYLCLSYFMGKTFTWYKKRV